MEWVIQLRDDTCTALRFFSRINIPETFCPNSDEPDDLANTATAFPLAGLLIAVIPAFIWIISISLLPPYLAAILAVFSAALITGALHEDGLADCADGLGGASDADRAMEIMRDSAIGTFGAIALLFSFAARIAALASLSPFLGVIAILLSHSTARASIVIALKTANYARSTGLGDSVRGGVDDFQTNLCLGLAIGIAVVFSIISASLAPIIAALVALAVAWSVLQYLKARLGGYTGDGLGAMEQLAEIAVLVVLAALWS